MKYTVIHSDVSERDKTKEITFSNLSFSKKAFLDALISYYLLTRDWDESHWSALEVVNRCDKAEVWKFHSEWFHAEIKEEPL